MSRRAFLSRSVSLSLGILFVSALIAGCASLPEPRWNPRTAGKVAVLPAAMTIYRSPALATIDPSLSADSSKAVEEAVAAGFRGKGYEMVGPAEVRAALAADADLGRAASSLAGMAWKLGTGSGSGKDPASRLASALGADLVVVLWGQGEYREGLFDLSGSPGSMGKGREEGSGWRNQVWVEAAVLDTAGVVLARYSRQEIPWSREAASLEGQMRILLSTVPERR